MICWKCGHLAMEHAELLYPENNVSGCRECYRSRANGSMFCKHEFETNLDYIERLAKEKKLA
jgi:hypothetical protein